MLNADAIRAVDDRAYETVEVPEWGGTVRLRGLTAVERDQYDREMVKFDNNGKAQLGRLDNVRALLVVRCLVDEGGDRMFRDSDARWLGDKSSLVIGKLFEVCSRLSGMRPEETEAAAEDFDGAQPDASSSG